MDDRELAESFYHAALDKLASGRPLDAIEACHQALELDPALLDAMHALVRAHLDSGQLDQGIAVANELVKLDPEDVLALTSLSILYQRQGKIPEAEAAALQAKLLGWKLELRSKRAAAQL